MDHLGYQKKFKYDYSDINKFSSQNVTVVTTCVVSTPMPPFL